MSKIQPVTHKEFIFETEIKKVAAELVKRCKQHGIAALIALDLGDQRVSVCSLMVATEDGTLPTFMEYAIAVMRPDLAPPSLQVFANHYRDIYDGWDGQGPIH